ncbi:MAG: hypothetical protein WCL11_08695 [Verrucomicrobiota bacterium]
MAFSGDLLGRRRSLASSAQLLQLGPGFHQQEFRRNALRVDAQHHRIAAVLAIRGRPNLTQDNMACPQPQEGMIKPFEAFFRLQLFPRPGVNLPADALRVQRLLNLDQSSGIHADTSVHTAAEVIIPSRMFAEGGQCKPGVR